jgi:rRNA maturation protein Nop10
MKRIRFCEKCKIYTMQEVCRICNSPTKICAPPKYRENDPYAKYRRMMLYG